MNMLVAIERIWRDPEIRICACAIIAIILIDKYW